MDKTNILIKYVSALELNKIEFETTEGKKYISDLGYFKKVVCFPPNQVEWNKVSITAGGYNITWACRFEVNVHQAVDAAVSVESIKQQA